jgi:hypothetical protein
VLLFEERYLTTSAPSGMTGRLPVDGLVAIYRELLAEQGAL